MILIVAHLLFHVWRHFWLKDNALRIMVPKPLHKWL
jgi:cytochrome b561